MSNIIPQKQKIKRDALTVNDYLSIDAKEKQLLLKNAPSPKETRTLGY